MSDSKAKPLTFIPTNFGLMLDYQFPEGCDMVVVCLDLPTGYQPVRLRLPHQVYREYLQDLRNRFPAATGFTLIPYRSSDRVTVSFGLLVDRGGGEQ